MQKSRVAIVRCDSYNYKDVIAAVERGIDLIGGIAQFVHPNEKILLKPNVLAGGRPERCISAHPQVFMAVAKMVLRRTENVSYGDSPPFGRITSHLKKSGLSAVADGLGIELADFEHGQEVRFHESPFTKSFVIANGVMQADGLISISKFKTHQLTRFTGAVKNQFGCIPGLLKAEYHVKMPNAYDFSKMLIALNLLLKPRLYIMDGIWAMQGNGPRNGKRIAMNVLLFSTDPIALDATAARMINLAPEIIPTSRPGEEWGLGVHRKEAIEIVGDPLEQFLNPDFDIERTPVPIVADRRGVSFIKNLISPRPVIDEEKCEKCGICVKACPVTPKALNWVNDDKSRPPAYTYTRCIRCFCCQELCPESAIHVEMPWLGRFIGR